MNYKYLLNTSNNKLHIEHGCSYAEDAHIKYMIFNSEDEVKKYTNGKYNWCKMCLYYEQNPDELKNNKSEAEIVGSEQSTGFAKRSVKDLGYLKEWVFNYNMSKYATIFTIGLGLALLICAIIAFFALPTHLFYMFLGLFAIFCLPFVFLFEFLRHISAKRIKKSYEYNKKASYLLPDELEMSMAEYLINAIKKSVIPSVIIAVALLILLTSLLDSDEKSQFESIFNKDPNSWSEDEEEYVNDFFEWKEETYG